MPHTAPKFLTIPQTAVYLGLSTRSVRRLISDGELPASRIGRGALRIRVAHIEAMVNANLVLPTAAGA